MLFILVNRQPMQINWNRCDVDIFHFHTNTFHGAHDALVNQAYDLLNKDS